MDSADLERNPEALPAAQSHMTLPLPWEEVRPVPGVAWLGGCER